MGDETRDAPLADLAADVRRRAERNDAGESAADDDVWDDLFDEGDVAEVVSSPDDDEGQNVQVISDRLCHNCPHFATPPEFGCTHEGTEIRELVETDRFRVVDCPVAAREDTLRESD